MTPIEGGLLPLSSIRPHSSHVKFNEFFYFDPSSSSEHIACANQMIENYRTLLVYDQFYEHYLEKIEKRASHSEHLFFLFEQLTEAEKETLTASYVHFMNKVFLLAALNQPTTLQPQDVERCTILLSFLNRLLERHPPLANHKEVAINVLGIFGNYLDAIKSSLPEGAEEAFQKEFEKFVRFYE